MGSGPALLLLAAGLSSFKQDAQSGPSLFLMEGCITAQNFGDTGKLEMFTSQTIDPRLHLLTKPFGCSGLLKTLDS